MKKIVSLITMAAMLAVSTPALARDRGGYERGYERHDYQRQHRNKCGTGCIIGLLVGGAVIGSAISKSNRNTTVERYEYPPVRTPTQVCQDIVKYDYYGNPYVTGRNCWYQ